MRSIRDVSITNARVQRARVVESLVRLRDPGQALEALPAPRPRDVGRQPQPRVLVRDDRPATFAEPLVRAGLLGVPVGIEERVNTPVSRQAGDRFHQRIGARSGTAIDEQHAVGTGVHNDVGFSGDSHDEEIVGEFQRAGVRRQYLCGSPGEAQSGRGQSHPCQTPYCGF